MFSNLLSKLTTPNKRKIQICMLGIWSCGKTTLLYKMVGLDGGGQTIPTIGFNVESVDCESHTLEFWDIGGGCAIPPLWKHYITPSENLNTNCIIFMIDSQNTDRQYLQESFRNLKDNVLQVANVKLLILLSKYDFDSHDGTVNQWEITDILNECKLVDPSYEWVIKKCNARNGKGVEEILDWIVENC
ncbi:ARF/SAR family small GTPase [Naegleria gruberi]|uniref:ARF/SAR family small GTPase n=1 Tax=Naegleria gruberi TaxID=5762 RepID=D2V1C6_NAEGR|nr:ARF/SAR family small GTPase [Naegleria gruberi]EFC49283.1 ARF/SAR family small GTPase [Naegleria gruberi]|eukprot:XP_002682027.1 ARF/SAR family small GTPase [Naegleria gruberi strain NEG-M]